MNSAVGTTTEHRFLEVLTELGQSLLAQGRKLVILLDGLDHAERDPLVRDSVLGSLPSALPQGVVFVVGTQELRNWQPLALREGREQRHVPLPLFSLAQTGAYLIEKHSLALSETAVRRITARVRDFRSTYTTLLCGCASRARTLGRSTECQMRAKVIFATTMSSYGTYSYWIFVGSICCSPVRPFPPASVLSEKPDEGESDLAAGYTLEADRRGI